jgi:DNA-binding NarL/FixJ family response regulator
MPKFLIVDDSQMFRSVLAKVLKKNWPDAAIIEAADGAQAGVANNLENPDIILLDLNMPGRDGYEVIKHIKTDYRKNKAKIVVLSGTDDPAAEGYLTGHVGVDGFLKKPVNGGKLIAMIQNLLAGTASSDSSIPF